MRSKYVEIKKSGFPHRRRRSPDTAGAVARSVWLSRIQRPGKRIPFSADCARLNIGAVAAVQGTGNKARSRSLSAFMREYGAEGSVEVTSRRAR